MGAEVSRQQQQIFEPYAMLQTIPEEVFQPMTIYPSRRTKIANSGFHCFWSRYIPDCKCPVPRSYHFSCYSEDLKTAFIGYGISQEYGALNDVWAFNTINQEWIQIKLTGYDVRPRNGSRSFYKDGKIYIFGGYDGVSYLSELHTIDVRTGEVQLIRTTNEISGRTTPIFFEHGDNIFVWGGYNSEFPNELNVLDMNTLTWKVYETNCQGRTAIPTIKYNEKIYAYGGSKTGCFLIFDPEECTVTEKGSYGSLPPNVTNSGMVVIDHYAFYLGGKANSKYCILFCCDLDKFTWFTINIVPDQNSVSILDGFIAENGYFLIPRVYSHTMVYEKETSCIYMTLGLPETNPPYVNQLEVSEVMAFLHMRDDMFSTFNLDY